MANTNTRVEEVPPKQNMEKEASSHEPSVKSQQSEGIKSLLKSSPVLQRSSPQSTPHRSPILQETPRKSPQESSHESAQELNTPRIKESVETLPTSMKSVLIPGQSDKIKESIIEAISNLQPNGKKLSKHADELKESVDKLSKDIDDPQSSLVDSNIEKIAEMSKTLTKEANSLRQSIKNLCDDIEQTKQELCSIKEEDVNFPYHLFLIEIIINRINMKCECFNIEYNNLVISASFLGKHPIVLYDPSYGKIENFDKLNVGKSLLFAITYDKICNIKDFEIVIQLTKQPPCSSCVTKIGETRMDYTKEFNCLKEELCTKWIREQPHDNILCTTSTPLSKNLYYLSCGDIDHRDSIGVIEITVRMSFLGKEISTAFRASPRPQGTSFLLKQDNGMTMYSCQKIEMDNQDKILLDEDCLAKKATPYNAYSHTLPRRPDSPISQISSLPSSKKSTEPYGIRNYQRDQSPKYDEIFTKMNDNELKIRVPKSKKLDRVGKYDKIRELCSCEDTPYNAGEQLHFELPPDYCYVDKDQKYTSNLKYTFKGSNKPIDTKERKIINITPTDCPVPVDMEKHFDPKKDVFILKIGKKLETKDKKTDLEIELVTPKGPTVKAIENNNISQQCITEDSKSISVKNVKGKKSKDKMKGKSNSGKAKKRKRKMQ